MRRLLLISAIMMSSWISTQTLDKGKLKGQITDELTGDPIAFCNFYIYQDSVYTGKGGFADETGTFVFDNLDPGKYIIGFSDVSHPETKFGVVLNGGKLTILNPVLGMNNLDIVDITYHANLFKPDAPTETIIDAKVIKSLSVAPGDIVGLALSNNSNIQRNEQTGSVYVRGSRDGGMQYVVDGIKMTEPARIPSNAIAEMRVITSGIPAEFGDVTGGIIYITTKKYTGRRQ